MNAKHLSGSRVRDAIPHSAARRMRVVLAGRDRADAALQPSTDHGEVRESAGHAPSEGGGAARSASGRQPYHDLPDVAELLAEATRGRLPPRAAGAPRRGLVHRGRRRDRPARWPGPRGRPRLAARAAGAGRDGRGRGHPPRHPALGRGGRRRLARAWPRSAARWRACARSSQSVMESFLRGKEADRLAAGQARHHAQRPLRPAGEGRAPRPGARASSTAARARARACSWSPCPRWS